MSEPLIELSDLYFGYEPGRPVFSGLDFALHPGERIGLTGANGCGKSTLFHLITGLLRPDSGRIAAFGRFRKYELDFYEVRRLAGYLLQDSEDQLFSPTVLEDVMFGPLNHGMSTGEARRVASETLEMLGLVGYEDRVTYKLSGGEKRLVSLATVLVLRPRVLLLDEPTAGLDAETEERIAAVLEGLDQEIVLVSHNRAFMERITGSVFAMQNGAAVATP